MSTSFFFSFGLLISFLLCILCSSIQHPMDVASDQEKDHQYNNNEDNDIPLMIYPKFSLIYRRQLPTSYHPRARRNSWFRVSTYQHMKPTSGSEEKTSGDNLLRWG